MLLGLIGGLLIAGGYFVWSKKSYSPAHPTCEQSKYEPNVYFNDYRKEMVFECFGEIDLKGNKCIKEYFILQTGEKISSQESACFIY